MSIFEPWDLILEELFEGLSRIFTNINIVIVIDRGVHAWMVINEISEAEIGNSTEESRERIDLLSNVNHVVIKLTPAI